MRRHLHRIRPMAVGLLITSSLLTMPGAPANAQSSVTGITLMAAPTSRSAGATFPAFTAVAEVMSSGRPTAGAQVTVVVTSGNLVATQVVQTDAAGQASVALNGPRWSLSWISANTNPPTISASAGQLTATTTLSSTGKSSIGHAYKAEGGAVQSARETWRQACALINDIGYAHMAADCISTVSVAGCAAAATATDGVALIAVGTGCTLAIDYILNSEGKAPLSCIAGLAGWFSQELGRNLQLAVASDPASFGELGGTYIPCQLEGPASITASSGTPQSTTTNTTFGAPLVVTVVDGNGNPVLDAPVTFTAPSAGGTGFFAGGSTTATVTTNGSGRATSPTITASSTAGSFNVLASVPGVPRPAVFSMTNQSAFNPPTNGPSAITTPSDAVTSSAATLNCNINPNGFPTSAWFVYATNSAFSNPTPTQAVSQGSGNTLVHLSTPISGLPASTTYWVRCAAQNGNGFIVGSVVSFTTSGPPRTPPTVQAWLDETATNGLNVVVTGVMRAAPLASIAGPALLCWGDGACELSYFPGRHRYQHGGVFPVMITATDSAGTQGSTTISITVVDGTPPISSGPQISSIVPAAPSAAAGSRLIPVQGSCFVRGLSVIERLPNGTMTVLTGSRIQEPFSSTSFILQIDFGVAPTGQGAGMYSISVKNPDQTTSNAFSFVVK